MLGGTFSMCRPFCMFLLFVLRGVSVRGRVTQWNRCRRRREPTYSKEDCVAEQLVQRGTNLDSE